MIQRAFKAPFLNKWQRNAVRLLPLSNIFPEALFIRIKRKPEYVARSLLAAKRSLLQDENKWFSTRPSNFEQIRDKHPTEQVCEQVCSIEKDIDRDSVTIGIHRFITVHYEELVHSPHRVMNDIKNFYDGNQRDNILEVRDDIPSSFPDANNKWVADPELAAIASYFS
jgi:hypothetical protein